MQRSVSLGHVLASAVLLIAPASGVAVEEEAPRVEADGTVHVPAFDLPETAYLSDESRAAMKHFRDVYGPEFGSFSEGCASFGEVGDDPGAMRAARDCVAAGYYRTAIYKDTVAKHPVEITDEEIAGVYTEVFVPEDGIAPANERRILISIHGGGFVVGSRYFSHTEAMQVAEMGGFKVVSPDYRMAPEFTHQRVSKTSSPSTMRYSTTTRRLTWASTAARRGPCSPRRLSPTCSRPTYPFQARSASSAPGFPPRIAIRPGPSR